MKKISIILVVCLALVGCGEYGKENKHKNENTTKITSLNQLEELKDKFWGVAGGDYAYYLTIKKTANDINYKYIEYNNFNERNCLDVYEHEITDYLGGGIFKISYETTNVLLTKYESFSISNGFLFVMEYDCSSDNPVGCKISTNDIDEEYISELPHATQNSIEPLCD